MEQKQHECYVQIGMRTIQGNGDYKFVVPLYIRVSDDKTYHALRDKRLRGISQIIIEKYRELLHSTVTEGNANGR